jgi:LemA protein
MNLTRIVGIVVVVVLLAGVANGCSTYNRFTRQEEEIKTAWSQVENQMQRRSDLIPNLVETTKGLAQQEKDVFIGIAEARAQMGRATTPTEKIAASNAETSALGRLIVAVENYPQLKSDQAFLHLMNELATTENQIAVARMRFNDRTKEYNQARRAFPANLTAMLFGFKEYALFDAPESVKTVPTVDFKKGK